MPQENFDLLAKIAAETKAFPGWSFELVDQEGAKRLVITIETVSNFPPHHPFRIQHWQPVPVAVYNEKVWRRWIFEQCIRAFNHELGEVLRFGDAEERPFMPCHGPGEDPYFVHDNRSGEERRTLQDGSIRQARKRG